jgi:hypothetical protein
MLDLLDRRPDEDGRIVGDLPGDAFRKRLGIVRHQLVERVDAPQRIRAGGLIDSDQGGRGAVQARGPVQIGGAELQAGDIAKAQDRPVGIAPDDYLLELLGRGEPALGLDVELELLVVGNRARTDPPHRRLHVLGLDGRDHVAGGQPEAGQLVGPEPDPHRIVLRTEQLGVADAGRASDLVKQIRSGARSPAVRRKC